MGSQVGIFEILKNVWNVLVSLPACHAMKQTNFFSNKVESVRLHLQTAETNLYCNIIPWNRVNKICPIVFGKVNEDLAEDMLSYPYLHLL